MGIASFDKELDERISPYRRTHKECRDYNDTTTEHSKYPHAIDPFTRINARGLRHFLAEEKGKRLAVYPFSRHNASRKGILCGIGVLD
jgi:hypothetical protein